MIEVERERRRWNMGVYLNPGNEKFAKAVQSEIYVDKTGLIEYTNQVINTVQRYVCVSRPRRFGKSMTADMLTAYYGKECDSRELFSGLKISQNAVFAQHLNQYPTIFLNMQEFLSRSKEIGQVIDRVRRMLLRELKNSYPDVDYFDDTDLVESLQDIYAATKQSFIIIIDEWDCVFREYQQDKKAQEEYLDFLRDFLKDKVYVALAYLTGILPIKKYGTHSALNMFDEFTMLDPGPLAEYVGFTEQEVEELCGRYQMDLAEIKNWYDGYSFPGESSVYSPRSVVNAMRFRKIGNYWNQTETFEALQWYIDLNFDGLRDDVLQMMAGKKIPVNTGSFTNDMTTFRTEDDVLTLLIHLGYLGYEEQNKYVFIPNAEVQSEYASAVTVSQWGDISKALKNSADLLQAVWEKQETQVAEGIRLAHFETSQLQYNDENALKSQTEFVISNDVSTFTQSAQEAYADVLKYAGASYKRDAVDTRIIQETQEGSYTYPGSNGGKFGIIDSQQDVGGWPTYQSESAPLDTDGDGIPDSWETANKLNPNDTSDGVKYQLSAEYTNLEVYINDLVKNLYPIK